MYAHTLCPISSDIALYRTWLSLERPPGRMDVIGGSSSSGIAVTQQHWPQADLARVARMQLIYLEMWCKIYRF